MPLHFRETMSGRVLTAEGPRRFSFTVDVSGPSFWGAWGRDTLELSGRAHLEGVVADAPLLPGSYLQIRLPFRRELVYAVAFRDAEGCTYRFFGVKDISYLLLPLTLRKLEGTLYRDGHPLGPGTLYFNYASLPGFLASWRITLHPPAELVG